MRICLLNPFPLSFRGGTESVLSSLNSELGRRGIETEVISLSESEMGQIPHFARVLISAILLRKLQRSQDRFDVIHAHAWSACVLKFIRGKPSLATAHGTVRGLLNLTADVIPFASRSYSSLITERLERSGFSSAQKVTAVSNSCMKELVEYYGIPKDKIKVVHNGLDMRQVHKVKTRIREKFGCDHLLFFIGRLAKQKGVEYLLEALPMLDEYDIKLVIAGTGPEETHLRQLVSELKLEKKVSFAGAVDERKKLELMSASDVFVCPSLWESFGMILLEAMACKLPVVATRVASIPEVVGDCGVLVEPRNPEKLSDGVKKILDDKKAAKRLAEKAYDRLTQNFTVERMADGYIKLYKELS